MTVQAAAKEELRRVPAGPHEGWPTPEAAVGLLARYFLNRADVVAILAPWDKPHAVRPGDLDALLLGHVLGRAAPSAAVSYAHRRGTGAMRGRYRVGAYAPGPEGTTRWLRIAFQGAGHADALADPTAAVLATQRAFGAAGLRTYLERPATGTGWHLWCFFDPPAPAAMAHTLGRSMVPRDVFRASGGLADPRAGRGIEIVPKQASLHGRGFGSLVWLPWWSGAALGGNVFYTDGADGLQPVVPRTFDTASPLDVERVLATAPPTTPASSGSVVRASRRPEIRVNNRLLDELVRDAWDAVHVANRPPRMFRRSRTWVRIDDGDDELLFDSIDETAAISTLADVATWVRENQMGISYVAPPRDVARVMVRLPSQDLPPIESIVTTPVFDANGELVLEAGYHTRARLWHDVRPGFEVAPIPETPMPSEILAAHRLFADDLLVDFPFAAESDRAHALAAFLLPFVRRMVRGVTPIHLVEAPTPGTGKSVLGDLVAIVATGRACESTTITRDEDETRKKITSLLLRGQPVVLLDNIREGIDSAQLAAALTTEQWSDRLLGQTRMLVLPNRATWIATANNPQLSLEIARRCVRIRLDPKTDRPWMRTTFKHAPIRDWAHENRAALVRALLVLVRGWIAAGRPPGRRALGSFESWARIVGGVLEHAGVHGFLDDTEKLYEAADREGDEWRTFVSAWHERFGTEPVGAQDLLGLALDRELLGETIGDKSLRSQATRLGRALLAVRDRQFGHLRVELAARSHNTTRWRVVEVPTP
jgi:hypothetical protein